jgi:hypothetical protein
MNETNQQMEVLIEKVDALGFNSGGHIPGIGEAIVIELRDIKTYFGAMVEELERIADNLQVMNEPRQPNYRAEEHDCTATLEV